jgi:hypothetical protein
MEKNLLNRAQATLLALATAALLVLAILNLREERQIQQPDDGVWWHETAAGLRVDKILPDSPGERAGLRQDDLLTAVNGAPVTRVADLERALYRTGPWVQVSYTITRDGIPLETPVKVIPDTVDHSLQLSLRLIGLIYLVIGFYVLFRRWGAPRATHFYLFCLVSFALYALKYTGVFDGLDWTVFWVNVMAEALQPALFLHFALSFPEERFKNLGRRWLRGCSGCGCGRSAPATPPSCCSTGSTRSRPPTMRCFTCWPRCSFCAATAARIRRCCASS